MMVASSLSSSRRRGQTIISPVVLAINANFHTPYTATDGVSYIADQYFTSSEGSNNSGDLIGYSDREIWTTDRWGGWTCAIPVSNGNYDVIFRFIELVSYAGVGHRVFSITVNGVSTGTIDIVSMAGGRYIPLDISVPITVSNGTISIVPTAITENPKINAIVIRNR